MARVIDELILLQVADPARQRIAIGPEHSDVNLIQVRALRVCRNRKTGRRKHTIGRADLVENLRQTDDDLVAVACLLIKASAFLCDPADEVRIVAVARRAGHGKGVYDDVLRAFERGIKVGAAIEEGGEFVGPVGLVTVANLLRPECSYAPRSDTSDGAEQVRCCRCPAVCHWRDR